SCCLLANRVITEKPYHLLKDSSARASLETGNLIYLLRALIQREDTERRSRL
ncbi:Uncharacterized protein DAT39_006824, partial [Clarias magur]